MCNKDENKPVNQQNASNGEVNLQSPVREPAKKKRIVNLKFGDYAKIEQHRFGSFNEMYTYKVIGQLNSNTYVDVPVKSPEEETIHGEVVPVLRCVCCGVDESRIYKYRKRDVRPSR